ncbi:MAG: hypothetical protein M3Q10_05755, partial [Chloroflexota bacterium]|nr:hypothetical protein [Chloroflexota bacterium]
APTLTPDQQRVRDIESAWRDHLPPGQDFATADPVELSGNRLRREVAIDTAGRLDVDPDQRPNLWQLLTRATVQTLIHSPAFSTSYTLLNIFGNPANLAIKGIRTGDTATVRGAFTEIRPALARRGNLLGKGADPAGGLAKIEDELGLTASPRYGSEVRYDVADATGAIREFLDRIYIGRIPIGRGKVSSVARPWENTARFNQALEAAQRRGAIAQRITQRLSEAVPDLRRVFDAEATRAGADPAAFVSMFDQLPLVFGADRLYDQILKVARGAGVSDARARTLASDTYTTWKGITRRELDAAGKDIEQAFGMSRTTNLDAWLANVFPFLSWHSRASFFLGEELLRSPVFMANFLRYREGAEDWEREHPNAPAAIKGLVRLSASPWGMAYYVDPRKIVLTSLFHNEQPLFEPEDAPWLLQATNWLRDKAGVSPHPILMTLAGITGALGDVTISNPLPMPEVRIFGHLIDAARAATGRGPGLPVVQMGLEAAREFITRHLPGVDTIEAGNPQAAQREAIDAQIEARNPGITDAELVEISADPDHPEHVRAWRDVAFARGFTDLWNAFSPLRAKVRQPVRDERRERIADARDAAAAQDTAATLPAGTPTPEPPGGFDAGHVPDTAARFVSPAGTQVVRADQLPPPSGPVTTARDALSDDPVYAADTRREDIIRAAGSPEAQRMVVDHAAYHDLGTERGRQAQELWVRTAFGTDGVFSPVTVQGMTYTPTRMAELDDRDRMTIADAVVAEAGMAEDRQALLDARETFEQSHPEYAAYKAWADAVRDMPDLAAWREQTARGNPNYGAWLREREAYLRTQHPNDEAGYRRALDQASVSPDAYLAHRGVRLRAYDPNPLPVRDDAQRPYDATEDAPSSGGPGRGGYPPYDPVQALYDDLAAYRAADQRASTLMDPGLTIDDFNPVAQAAIRQQYEQTYGEEFPTLRGNLREYVAWYALQPETADRSVEAFVRWRDRNRPADPLPAA